MTFRFANILLSVFVASVLSFGPSVWAQESISADEGRERGNPENVIEIELGSLQTESMRKFLQEHRLDLRNSNLDLSVIVKEVREDFINIKQEQKRTLQVTKKFKTPVLVNRKTFPSKKEIFEQSESSAALDIFFPEQKFFESQKSRRKEEPLSLHERQRRAKIETVRREKFIRDQNTRLGKLKAEINEEPLKSYQAKLTEFSERIKNLLGQLQEREGVQRSVFLDLGNTYLESHRYLNTLEAKDRLKLTRFAAHSRTILGSHESALWVFKMALVRNPNDGETNFLIGKILSETGEQDLALRRVRNAQVLFGKNGQPDRAVQTQSLIESIKSSSPEN